MGEQLNINETNNYWHDYWNNGYVVNDSDPQKQVGRTRGKRPISASDWEKTLSFIWDAMCITKDSEVLELCCGNGMLTLPLAKKVKSVIAVDFSRPIIEELNKQLTFKGIKNVTTITEDVNNITFPESSLSHILMYFSLQYLSEKNVIVLFENAYKFLKNGGEFFIGDIPDRAKLWNFANIDDYVSMYFNSVKNDKPTIGSWFLQEDLLKMGEWAGFSKVKIIKQPEYQINSRYRFDLLLQK